MKQVRRQHGAVVWAAVRAEYLLGAPVGELEVRYGVTESALRKRAEREGWTRVAQARFEQRPQVRWLPTPGPIRSRRELTVEQFRATWPEIWGEMEDVARECALDALSANPEDAAPMCDWAYRWRAATFGPDCAAEDARLKAERAAEAAETAKLRYGTESSGG